MARGRMLQFDVMVSFISFSNNLSAHKNAYLRHNPDIAPQAAPQPSCDLIGCDVTSASEHPTEVEHAWDSAPAGGTEHAPWMSGEASSAPSSKPTFDGVLLGIL